MAVPVHGVLREATTAIEGIERGHRQWRGGRLAENHEPQAAPVRKRERERELER